MADCWYVVLSEMGGMTAPVAGSGSDPTWTARVLNPSGCLTCPFERVRVMVVVVVCGTHRETHEGYKPTGIDHTRMANQMTYHMLSETEWGSSIIMRCVM